jgi:hypothetical protein
VTHERACACLRNAYEGTRYCNLHCNCSLPPPPPPLPTHNLAQPHTTSHDQITRVLGDHRLFPIGAAVMWLVGNATQPLVLFLEKDFALLENARFVTPRLDEGRKMLQDNEVRSHV